MRNGHSFLPFLLASPADLGEDITIPGLDQDWVPGSRGGDQPSGEVQPGLVGGQGLPTSPAGFLILLLSGPMSRSGYFQNLELLPMQSGENDIYQP